MDDDLDSRGKRRRDMRVTITHEDEYLRSSGLGLVAYKFDGAEAERQAWHYSPHSAWTDVFAEDFVKGALKADKAVIRLVDYELRSADLIITFPTDREALERVALDCR